MFEDDYENSICCFEAENDIIWSKDFLYKKNFFPTEEHYRETPDISHLHEDWWMYEYIPF